MRASLVAFSVWLPYAMAVMNFITPPRYGSMHDFKSNVEYSIGYNLPITWTPGVAGKKASLELYQVNLTSGSIFFGEGETIAEGMVDMTSWKWQISTSKDLGISNVFQLAIWDESKDSYDDWCHYFNITGGTGTDAPSTPTGAAVPTATTPPNRPTEGPPTEAATAITTSGTEQKKDWTGMSTGAKITMGVILPIVAVAGFAVGWCVLGRQRRRRQAAAGPTDSNAQWQPIPKDVAQTEAWQQQQGTWPQQGPWPQHASWLPPEQWQQQELWKQQQEQWQQPRQPEQPPPQELPTSHDRHQIDDSPRETAHEMPNAERYELPSAPPSAAPR
ncbi:hypothetical protein PG985_000363 [Apiospora marii]|uniref:uncharacterized protein n=1 Tax=Apiospora marii TaxID=335849 RepID=UPI00312CEED7